MIGKLKGILSEVEGNKGLVEMTNGVYYEVFLTPDVLSGTSVGKEIEIYTYFHVKEDAQTLYGFSDKRQHTLFQMLLGVDGVGPKSAFTIISYASSAEITDAVIDSNHTFFNSVPGIGKKTAHKILLELSGKLDVEFQPGTYSLSRDDVTVVDALVALGFDKKSAHTTVESVDRSLGVEERVKAAIRQLTKK